MKCVNWSDFKGQMVQVAELMVAGGTLEENQEVQGACIWHRVRLHNSDSPRHCAMHLGRRLQTSSKVRVDHTVTRHKLVFSHILELRHTYQKHWQVCHQFQV